MSELHGLQTRITDIESTGTRLIAVSPDSVEQNRGVAERLGLSFPIVSDADMALTTQLGLVHEGGGPGGEDIPRPATLIIRDGAIVWKDLTDNYRVRIRPDELVRALRSVFEG